MANKKITELTALTTPADTDVLAIVDVAGAETKKITVANLTGGGDDHFVFNGGGYVSTVSEMAISTGMSTTDSTTFNYITTFLIPIACRVVNVISQSQSSGGSTDVRVYKPTTYNQFVSTSTELGSAVNHASMLTGVVYTSTFDTSTYNFAAGDRMGITFDSSTGNLNGLSVTILMKKV